ncbi:MAG TPA: hypothetical protein VM307_14220 [Egibacteraceae bacterium]|nr:hypothetical protein [Egibacteraceae bacterium]
MSERKAQPPGAIDAPSAAVPDNAPSPAARARLAGAVRDRAEAYRTDATMDLTLVDALLRMDRPEDAVRTLDEHRASLQAMARDLQIVVADAAVEREAERVCQACIDDVPARRRTGGLRRRLIAVTSAAAVALALALPTTRMLPRPALTSADARSSYDDLAAARQRLQAARSWARAARHAAANPDGGPAADAVVRAKVTAVLSADASGGPADRTASSDTAEVVDLQAYRTARSAVRDGQAGAAAVDDNNDTPPAEGGTPRQPELPTLPKRQEPQEVRLPDGAQEATGAVQESADVVELPDLSTGDED